ncbi:lysine exporter LysO family protein [Prolixibacter denitrificans]|uniref:Lysine exporter LysO-like protein n=1 Tax=Prolixibacter denitrificans TaxID=1541063 RepID=A0A2P8CBU4_9BACT|nr:lysine exporter LysO family protein [Prolixibacter denitrificans]PSK82446.1 lysine exporter LysO-like protein [Prolixibacter denitrificans]GET22812.1 membrane protein [Prolixibacter denitrificans]
MKGSLIILSFFALGLILGVTNSLPEFLLKTDFSMYALYILMFLVGIGIGADRKSWKVIQTINVKIFLVPLGVMVGTAIGVTIVSLFLPNLTIREAMAVGAGYGYYSLSSIFITQMHGETLGVMALLSNIIREVATLLLTPLFVKYFGKLAGIMSGGATAMDTTLPIITRYSGKDYAIISLFSGIVLTILVPVIITFILHTSL